MADFSFRVLATDDASRARRGVLRTARGEIETPCLVPVATCAAVRALDAGDLESLGAPCALANTYHLHLRPGDGVVRRLGGLRGFTAFDRPFFTDSGGFQAFSLGMGKEHGINKLGTIFPGNVKGAAGETPLAVVTEEGIRFRSIYDGTEHLLTPRRSMEIQANLGADAIMALDECTSPLSDREYTRRAMERTHRWAVESLEAHDPAQALYGIVQGGWFEDLRIESAGAIAALPFEGVAIGGSLGKSKADMHRILDWVVPRLDGRPRHLLGIGAVDDLFECVARGIDTFDCVGPTRMARRGSLLIGPAAGGTLTNGFHLNIRNARFREDPDPIEPGCACPTCTRYSRAYLRHLFLTREFTYYRLATLHNLHFVLDLMAQIRRSIAEGTFATLRTHWLLRI